MKFLFLFLFLFLFFNYFVGLILFKVLLIGIYFKFMFS